MYHFGEEILYGFQDLLQKAHLAWTDGRMDAQCIVGDNNRGSGYDSLTKTDIPSIITEIEPKGGSAMSGALYNSCK